MEHSERRVHVLSEQGRVEGVQRLSKAWAIPQNATKPFDALKRKGLRSNTNRQGGKFL